jgi:hypothetical protein
VRYYFNPLLTFSMIPCADPDFWAPLFAYADLQRLPEADFEVGGRRYGVYGHNWRAMPAVAWLALLADREIAVTPPGEQPPSATPVVVLSRVDFGAAVSDALKNYHRPDLLARNPLLQSRLVMEPRLLMDHSTPGAGQSQAVRVAALQELILGGCHALEQSPRDVKFYRALYHTYIQPAPTQEQAAALLDLPFSTYRRHLKEGTARLADILWQMELRGPTG